MAGKIKDSIITFWVTAAILILVGAAVNSCSPSKEEYMERQIFKTQLISDTGICKTYKIYNHYQQTFSTQCAGESSAKVTWEEQHGKQRLLNSNETGTSRTSTSP